MRLKTILFAIAVLAVSFFASLKLMDWLSPSGAVKPPEITGELRADISTLRPLLPGANPRCSAEQGGTPIPVGYAGGYLASSPP